MPVTLASRGVAEELRALRKKAGLSISSACELSGVPYSTWRNWERDPEQPSSITPPNIAISWLLLYLQYQKFTGFSSGWGKTRTVPEELSLDRFKRGIPKSRKRGELRC